MEPRVAPIMPPPYAGAGGPPSLGWPAQTFDLAQILADSQACDKRSGNRGAGLPDFRAGPGSLGDNYLGVSGSNEWVSPIKGTSLTLFGMELDLAEFITNDNQEAFSPTSYENFLQIALSNQTFDPPSLPPYPECKAFCEWYFKAVNCHAPIVHKPDILDMVDRLHTDTHFQPTIAETVQLHMVLAMMLFQYSTRNAITNNWADHYRYAISYLPKLMQERTLPNMQAIALICLHLRNFTKPGAAWFMSSLTLTLCIEMGLHRSVKAWTKSSPEPSELEVELRKRVFWSVLVIHCSISNKLGRPLAVRLEDFDVEFPVPMNDFTSAEGEVDDWHKCSYRVGCHNFKWVLVNLQVQSTIYSVRAPPHSYELTLQKLEKDLETFKKSIPIELQGGPQTAQDDRVCSLYLQFGAEELNLLIHHPAVCRTQNQEAINKNLDICLHTSSELLRIAQNMRALKSLDTTWLNATVWLSAMFVTLFTWHQRKDRITSAQLNDLKSDMETWLGIIGDIGQMLGSGPRLQNAVRSIVYTAIDTISKDLAARTASAAVASAAMARTSPQVNASDHGDPAVHPYSTAPPGYAPVYTTDGGQNQDYLPNPADDHSLASQSPYASSAAATAAAAVAANQFAYPDPTGAAVPPYPSNSLPFDTSYGQVNGGAADIKPDLQAQLTAHNAGQPLPSHQHQQGRQQGQQQMQDQHPHQQFLNAFADNNPHNGYAVQPHHQQHSPHLHQHQQHHHQQQQQQQHQQQQQQQMIYGPAAWRHFTTDMMSLFNNGFSSPPPQHLSSPYSLDSASTLLALGGGGGGNGNGQTPNAQQNKPTGFPSLNGAVGAGDNQGVNVMALQGVSDASVGIVNDHLGMGGSLGGMGASLWPLSTYGPVTSTPASMGGI